MKVYLFDPDHKDGIGTIKLSVQSYNATLFPLGEWLAKTVALCLWVRPTHLIASPTSFPTIGAVCRNWNFSQNIAAPF
ncbi:hypothetical protein [Pontibacter roseus]|uniref:hypothetical protein n=1 Tax=Pontibacter roseus TaxID=336989 RepID=UPI0012F98A68|nr:hypothetical protein [Pontibacter roseus]